jgi:hypothetical protein
MKIAMVAFLGVGLLVGPAWADKPAKAGKHGKAKVDDDGGQRHDGRGGFSSRERDLVRVYYVEHRGKGCPPGLAKKGNGCLPPGQAKKRYLVGRPLDVAVVIEPLPPVLVTRLGAPPAGYRYGVVDGDVVKLVIGTLLVVDAIEGLAR